MNVPPVAPFPEEFHGKTAFALIACHSGNLNEGRDLFKDFTNYGDAFLELDQPLPYVELQKVFDAGMPKGIRWYSKAHYINEISDGLIVTIIKNVKHLKGGVTMACFEPMGGCVKKVDPSETAFPHCEANLSFHILTGWNDKIEDEENIEWAKNFHNAVKEFATGGVYVNLLAHDEEERVKAAYGDNYDRLVEIKKKYDPNNLFNNNFNIRPEGS